MGISGLTSILERSSASNYVDLIAESRKVRSHARSVTDTESDKQTMLIPRSVRTATSSSLEQVNKVAQINEPFDHFDRIEHVLERHHDKLVMLVDGLGFFYELASVDQVIGRWLPCYDILHRRVCCLIESLRSQGIELVVYFDSPSTETIKHSTHVNRTSSNKDDVKMIAQRLSLNYLSVSNLTPLCAQPLDSQSYSSQSYQRVRAQCLQSLQMMKVACILCQQEADVELSHDARKYGSAAANSQSNSAAVKRGSIYGIISNDSDCAAMVGCRWIPVASLVLEWGDKRQAESVNQSLKQRSNSSNDCLAVRPCMIDQYTEALYSSERSRTNYAAPVLNPQRAFFNERYLIGVRCRVWTPGKIANTLGLSTCQQLVDLAILAGNDYTKEYVNQWKSIIAPSRRFLDVLDVAKFLGQSSNRNKRVSEMHAFRGILNNEGVARAVKQSLLMYEGFDYQPAHGKPMSLTHGVDSASLTASDCLTIRSMLARDELPAETLSVIARDSTLISSYPEASVSYSDPHSNDPRCLWLPKTEAIHRFPRAAFALFCGRRVLRLIHCETGQQSVEDIQLEQLLPSLSSSLARIVRQSRLVLLELPGLPLDQRLMFLVQSLNPIDDPTMIHVFRDAHVPAWLRFPIIHLRFWRRMLVNSLSVSRRALKPWFQSLQDMRLFLHVARQSASQHTLVLNGGLNKPLPPIMTAVSLFTQYQSGWNRLRSLIRSLDLPEDLIATEAPMHSMHGALFLLLVQNNLMREGELSLHESCLARLSCITDLIQQQVITVDGISQETIASRVEDTFRYQELFEKCVWDD